MIVEMQCNIYQEAYPKPWNLSFNYPKIAPMCLKAEKINDTSETTISMNFFNIKNPNINKRKKTSHQPGFVGDFFVFWCNQLQDENHQQLNFLQKLPD